MKRLGTVDLPTAIQWVGQFDWSPVDQDVLTTIGGTPVVFSRSLRGGREIDLQCEQNVAWFTRQQVDDIRALSRQAGAVFTLTWGNGTFQVVFRHQDAPAVSFSPIRPHGQLFYGTIKLMTTG